MNIAPSRRRRIVLAAALEAFAGLRGAVAENGPPGVDPVTGRIREIIRQSRGDEYWGAEPPAQEVAKRGTPVEATILTGSGHAMVMIDSDGRPLGSQLRLLHVKVDGDLAAASECVLRLGKEEDRSCPPAPFAFVDCATWTVPADAARAALVAARAALFVRVYEKKFVADPRVESLDSDDLVEGMAGGVAGGTTADFVAVASVVESGEHPLRVTEEWAGYEAPGAAGRFARVDAATHILGEAFPQPRDAFASAPAPAVLAGFSRLFATLPLDTRSWWWVRERMVLMIADLGLPGDNSQLKKYLTPKGDDPSDLRTRDYALEALARRTGRDTRCDGGRRLAADAVAAAWLH